MSRPKDLRQSAPVLLLCFALLASGVLLLSLSSGLTFFQDTWAFLIQRRGFSAADFLSPHNEHIVVIPVAINKLLLAIFGMTSAVPEFVVLTLLLLGTAGVLFIYVRRRIGPWPALIAAVLLLFIGPAWQVLLWPFEVGFVGAALAGIAMLLALDRDDQAGDIAACVFLTISIGFSDLGVAFAVGAAIDILLRRKSRGWRRVYVAAIPLLLYALWYVTWGRHTNEHHLSLHNILASPPYVLNGLAGSIDSLLGLGMLNINGVDDPVWGRPILIALIAALIYRQARRPGFSPRLWPVAASAATFWLLAAFNYFPGREPTSSRYMHTGAVFILLLAADLLVGIRIGRQALLLAGAIALAAVAANLVILKEGKDWLAQQTTLTRADLAAIEISRKTVSPNFDLTPEIAGTPSLINVEAGRYLEDVREFGSPAYSTTELTNAPEDARKQADIVLVHALPVTTEIKTGAAGRAVVLRRPCTTVPGGAGPSTPPLPVRPGVINIKLGTGAPGTIRLRRFAVSEYPYGVGGISGGSTAVVRIPSDRNARPWFLQVEASQSAEVCR